MRTHALKQLTFLLTLLLLPPPAHATDNSLVVFSGGAVKSALTDTIAVFEKSAGLRVSADFAPMGTLRKKIEDGAQADVLVLASEVMDEAERKGWVVPGTAVELGRIGVGVAVNEKATAPDISTPDAFKATLLAARSIVMINPATGTSGRHLAQVFDQLGIADALKPKTTYLEGGYVVEAVGRGEIEIGLHQITEILPVKGIKLVGPLPGPLQKVTIYAAAVTKSPARADDARRLLAFLRTPEMQATFAAKGFLAAP
ncbi:MAG: molybdate ABC transporter substrate-binding protein [Hyphomicrobiaceae bacterium]